MTRSSIDFMSSIVNTIAGVGSSNNVLWLQRGFLQSIGFGKTLVNPCGETLVNPCGETLHDPCGFFVGADGFNMLLLPPLICVGKTDGKKNICLSLPRLHVVDFWIWFW